MEVWRFRREVLCALQMFELFRGIVTRNTGALERILVPKERGSSRAWPTTPKTVVEDYARRIDFEPPGVVSVPRGERILTTAWDRLRFAVHQKTRDVSPTFMQHNSRDTDPLSANSLAFEQGWYCPDLLSAIHLSFYLYVTGSKRVAFCEACGKPLRAARSDKRYCNSTCRSNARHARNRERRSS